MTLRTRRDFMRRVGLSTAAAPFVLGLPSLGHAETGQRKKRLIVMFSPNGIVPDTFWPDETGKNFKLKEILSPLEPLKDRTLVAHGICNRVRGDGDSHMRGMSCLLTGIELFPGNIQGGSHTPAGWASGISIDQEIKNFLQAKEETRTRFGSLEFGVTVPPKADPWTRMVYAGPNKPVAPIDDPYQMFDKMYGSLQDQETLQSILDAVVEDLRRVRVSISREDQRLLEEHETFVRDMEKQLRVSEGREANYQVPELRPGVDNVNDNMPSLAKMQIDLLVSSFVNDMARIATLQFTRSVGGAKMKWLGIEESHHTLSHDPDLNKESQEKLTKINKWFCEQLVYLAQKLDETPEPGGAGTMLDNTTVIWTNELGKGNSHTLNNIPFVMVGNGLGFEMGRSVKFKQEPHNRLLLSIAHAFGHQLETFGNPKHCGGGSLNL